MCCTFASPCPSDTATCLRSAPSTLLASSTSTAPSHAFSWERRLQNPSDGEKWPHLGQHKSGSLRELLTFTPPAFVYQSNLVSMKVKVLNMSFGAFYNTVFSCWFIQMETNCFACFAFHPKRPPGLHPLTFTACIHPLTAVKEAD